MTVTPPRPEPVFNIPRVVVGLLVLLAAVHGLRSMLSDQADADVLARFAFVPGRLAMSFDPGAVIGRLLAATQSDLGIEGTAAVARFFLGDGSPQPWTIVTYALLHGSWTHLGLNAVWFVAFGAPVARRIGWVRFLALFVVGALAGALAHAAVDPFSLQPLVGASASVSAFMGAALRFMFQSAAALDGTPRDALHLRPRRPMTALLRDRRVVVFLLVWFLSNLLTGLAATPLGLSDAPIAWQAHIGGFLLGLLGFPLFDPIMTPRVAEHPVDASAPPEV